MESERTYTFEREIEFNTIVFEESGNKVDEVKVEARIGGEFVEIYRQDEMGVRTAVVDPVKTNEVKVKLRAEQDDIKIDRITFKNTEKLARDCPFRVTSYLVAPLNKATRLCFDKLGMTTDLILIGYSQWNEKGDIVYSYDPAVLEKDIAELKKAACDRRFKIWYCIGGYTAECRGKQDKLLVTPKQRERLASQCVSIVKKFDLEGVDVDYEYPANQAQWDNYGAFLLELKRQMAAAGKKVSCALAPWGVSFSKEVVAAIDQVQTMVYDLFDEKRRHATYSSARNSVAYFKKQGFEAEQINLGLPLYGRQMDDGLEPWPSYASMIESHGDRIDAFTNACCNSYFTGKAMNRDKTLLALQSGLGGVMTFHLACDAPASDPRSIFRGIREVMDAFIEK